MSYLIHKLESGEYRIELGPDKTLVDYSVIRAICRDVEHNELMILEKKKKDEEVSGNEKIKKLGIGMRLPPNSDFRAAIVNDKVDNGVMSSITRGLLFPNGTRIWSSYFSKINWEEDWQLFDDILKERYSKDGFAAFKKHHGDTLTRDVFDYLYPTAIVEINKNSTSSTNLVNIGLTDSRDYSDFAWACSKIYEKESWPKINVVSVEFAKENIKSFADVICDAAIYVLESNCLSRAHCSGLVCPTRCAIIDSAESIPHISKYISDYQWEEIARSPIWHLVKDVVALRKLLQQNAA